MWKKIQHWYDMKHEEDRLGNLTKGMIQQDKKPPKLKAYAAQVRALVPFACSCAHELLDPGDAQDAAAIHCVDALDRCYKALSNNIFAAPILHQESLKCALQYVSLNEAAGPQSLKWRLKPKLHMWLHLCSDGAQPSLFWTYRDENWGGSISHTARRRGGLLSCKALSQNVLVKACIQQPMLRIV